MLPERKKFVSNDSYMNKTISPSLVFINQSINYK